MCPIEKHYEGEFGEIVCATYEKRNAYMQHRSRRKPAKAENNVRKTTGGKHRGQNQPRRNQGGSQPRRKTADGKRRAETSRGGKHLVLDKRHIEKYNLLYNVLCGFMHPKKKRCAYPRLAPYVVAGMFAPFMASNLMRRPCFLSCFFAV